MQFLTKAKLQLEYKDNGKKWFSLKNDLIFYTGKEKYNLNNIHSIKVKKSDLIIVPKEMFITDLASVPKGLNWLYPPNGSYLRASIIHDYVYSLPSWNRLKCDILFLHCMKADNVPFFTRWIFFFAVRSFGWYYR